MSDDHPVTPARALVPLAEKTVLFYGDAVPVAQTAPSELYVPLRPLATFLGSRSAVRGSA